MVQQGWCNEDGAARMVQRGWCSEDGAARVREEVEKREAGHDDAAGIKRLAKSETG